MNDLNPAIADVASNLRDAAARAEELFDGNVHGAYGYLLAAVDAAVKALDEQTAGGVS